MGLYHTFEADHQGDNIIDPSTGSPFGREAFWDLVYLPSTGPGVPPQFFDNVDDARNASASAGLPLERIDKHDVPSGAHNCQLTDFHGRLECEIQPEGSDYPYKPTHPDNDPLDALGLGMGFSYSDPSQPEFGVNVMSYVDLTPPDPSGNILYPPRSFSSSQVEVVRKYLRYETLSSGYTASPVAANRTLLGRGENRGLAYVLDFNGDKKRDIAWWTPPDDDTMPGDVSILLSPNFTGPPLRVSFGALGDIPVPGDYDGDGLTNLAFFRPGGGGGAVPTSLFAAAATWRWCESPTVPDVAMCGATNVTEKLFGRRGDVPLPGLSFD
jgi:hypothetical protein